MAASKAVTRPLRIYDVFGLMPAPTDKDGGDIQFRYNVIEAVSLAHPVVF